MPNTKINFTVQGYLDAAREDYSRRYFNCNKLYRVLTFDGHKGFIQDILSANIFNFRVTIDHLTFEVKYYINDNLVEETAEISRLSDALTTFRIEYDAEREQIWNLYKIIKNLKKSNRYTARLYNIVKYNKSW